MLSATTQLALVAGNVLSLLTVGYMAVRWLRGWLTKQVAQPVADLKAVVEEQGKRLEDVDARAREAHVRIDQLLLSLGSNNA